MHKEQRELWGTKHWRRHDYPLWRRTALGAIMVYERDCRGLYGSG